MAVVAQSKIPTVFVGLPGQDQGVYAIDADYIEAGRQAVRALAKADHEHLTLVMPDHPTLAHLNFLERFQAGTRAEAATFGRGLSVIGCAASYPSTLRTVRSLGEMPNEGIILGPLGFRRRLVQCPHPLWIRPGRRGFTGGKLLGCGTRSHRVFTGPLRYAHLGFGA